MSEFLGRHSVEMKSVRRLPPQATAAPHGGTRDKRVLGRVQQVDLARGRATDVIPHSAVLNGPCA